jgi:hypothetical protein
MVERGRCKRSRAGTFQLDLRDRARGERRGPIALSLRDVRRGGLLGGLIHEYHGLAA